MKSMTGYGRAELTLPDHSGVVEISSVNKKGFEFLLHGPKEWQFFEKKAHEIIRIKAERGRVRLSILLKPKSILDLDSPEEQFVKVAEQLEALKQICTKNGLSYTPTTDLVQRIISTMPRDILLPSLENIEEFLIQSTNLALNDLVSMRQEEGSALSIDLKNRLDTLLSLVSRIEEQTKGHAIEWRDKMLQRLTESGLEIDCENEAVRREFAVYAEKSDVTEEITRIHSHLDQLHAAIKQTHPIGRKLEFIVQELGREFNTLGSKSAQSNVSNLVIDAKVEIEKIREQVMNIE
jgi:uncharacterized protein (TIGR00255 family)